MSLDQRAAKPESHNAEGWELVSKDELNKESFTSNAHFDFKVGFGK